MITRTGVGYQSDAWPTKDTPYLALTGELWGVLCEYLWENWPCYKGIALYLAVAAAHAGENDLPFHLFTALPPDLLLRDMPKLDQGCISKGYDLLSLRTFKFSLMDELYICQCMGKIFCVEFQRVFHTKCLNLRCNFHKILKIYELSDVRAHTCYQELPCGIGVAGNPWPVEMAINNTARSWPQGRLSPGGPQRARALWQVPLTHDNSLFSLLHAPSAPQMIVANHWPVAEIVLPSKFSG